MGSYTKEELKSFYNSLSSAEQEKIRGILLKKSAMDNMSNFGEYVYGHKPARHHIQIIKLIEENPNDNLLIIAPPRHAKTTYCGVILPTYMIAKQPGIHIIYVSSTIEQSLKQSIQVRDTVQNNPQFREICSDVTPAYHRQWQKNSWTVKSPRFLSDKDPTFIATGFDGNILGSTGDLIIIDDLNDRKNTATPYMRQKVQDWVVRTLLTRLSPKGRVICIMTRWHADDLAAFFKDNNFKTLVMPALGCGGCTLDHEHRPLNEALWPSEWSFDRLVTKVKNTMDMWQWEGVYQGNPTPSGGSIWREEWWRYYRTDPNNEKLPLCPEEFSLKVQSWDTSQKTGEENDWSVCTTWGFSGGNYYLLDVFRKKMEYPELKQAVKNQYGIHLPGIVLVENASSGQSLVQELPVETSIPILPIKVESDKQARGRAASWAAQAGRVYLPESSDWLYEFVQEMNDFPQGRWRDQADSVSQALTWIRLNTSDDSTLGESMDANVLSRSHWAVTQSDRIVDIEDILGSDELYQDGFLSRWNRF